MLTQAISGRAEGLNNELSKQGQECTVITHAVVVALKQSESEARMQNIVHLPEVAEHIWTESNGEVAYISYEVR